jgi:hypothetical protein
LCVIVAAEHERRHSRAEAQARLARDDGRRGREGFQRVAESAFVQRRGALLRQRHRIASGLRTRVAGEDDGEQQAEYEQAAAEHVACCARMAPRPPANQKCQINERLVSGSRYQPRIIPELSRVSSAPAQTPLAGW